MSLPFYNWSRTAASNATADSTVNWAEGQSPSSVNDSARAMMASAAAYRDDVAGAIATGGTSTAYTVTSYQIFDTLAHLNGQVIAFTPHATNGATVTLNVDGLGAKPLRISPSVELQSGTLILGTPYAALYNNSDSVFYLMGVGPAPGIPLASGMDYWGTTAPSSAFVFPIGQAISRTTYATLFALVSTAYGTGDGSTTFNLPDKRERVSAMKAAAASLLTTTYFGAVSGQDSTTLGAVGGLQSHTLTASQHASHTHTGTTDNDSPDHTHQVGTKGAAAGGDFTAAAFTNATGNAQTGGASVHHTHTFTTASQGSGSAHNNTQPTIICNYIMRII